MSFKIGDIVERRSPTVLSEAEFGKMGVHYTITSDHRIGGGYTTKEGILASSSYFKLVEPQGPVVTTTVTTTISEIKAGAYDGVSVFSDATATHVGIAVDYDRYNKSDIGKIINHLTAIRDVLKD